MDSEAAGSKERVMRAVIGYLVVAAVLVGGGLVLRSGSALERRVEYYAGSRNIS